MATYIPPELDKTTQETIQAVSNRAAEQGQKELEDIALENTNQSEGLINAPKESYSGESGGAVLSAINNRAKQRYAQDMKRMRVNEQGKAAQLVTQRRTRALNLLVKERQYNEEIAAAKARAEAEARAARSDVLGGVLGIVGAVAGGMVGGAGGALAGSYIGSGLGKTVGGM